VNLPAFRGFAAVASAERTSRLKGKVAVITGAAAGIGRESALLFAQNGVDGLVLADFSPEGQKTADDIKNQFGTRAVFIKTDVSKESDCKAMIDIGEKTFGKVNVLFNNAGIMMGDDDNAMTTPESTWDRTFSVNVKGVWFGCKYAIPAMLRAGGGSIVNTASFVGLRGAATPQLAYTSSKGAVLAMTRELAVIHARQNIRANSLCPGPLKTKLLMDFLDTEAKKQRRLVHLPMGRFGEAKEMANAALFLASDESSYMTGNDFLVDGGLCAAYVTPE
jgi:NAD(P)-dependent dehydrogenase (short-subunit alcohol dehydrogenase family)